MRVLVLSQYFDPEPIPKPGEVTDGLQERGHEVYAIAELPNYPSGKLYPGYRMVPYAWGRRGSATLLRTFTVPYHGRSSLGRAANYLVFVLTATLGSLFLPRADVIYVWHPPQTVGLAAVLISALRRTPFVIDVQDIWPDELLITGLIH